ncbi:SRPBCC family protein [Marinobacter sp. AC-23]|uniref:SRPBCC family protein n=1 Tax=Marinobacter sp. AC-23 TaxID=1879031 RepID=UPI0009F3B2C5|nr:SRPBCC family protein [Marinobacter sp. AC-23]
MGKTYQSIVVNAPAEKIWNALRDFHDLSWAPDVISDVDVVGEKKGDQSGAKRVLNGAFHETCVLSMTITVSSRTASTMVPRRFLMKKSATTRDMSVFVR